MFDSLVSTRRVLDDLAVSFDASTLTPQAALRMVDEFGAIRRLVDGMLAKAAKRATEGDLYTSVGAAAVARTLGVATGEVRSAIDTATKLETLPATDAAVRAGSLSAREAQMIADAAAANPAAETDLLASAEQGLVPLRDACVKARAAVEDPTARRHRQHQLREWHTWTDGDGMVAGRYRFTPEVGGMLKTKIDAHAQRIFRAHKAGTEHDPLAAYAADAAAALILGAAFLTVIIKKGKDILTVAHLGRHVPAEVQTALLVSGRECDVEGCNQRGYLERDHVRDHAKGGPTSFANLGL